MSNINDNIHAFLSSCVRLTSLERSLQSMIEEKSMMITINKKDGIVVISIDNKLEIYKIYPLIDVVVEYVYNMIDVEINNISIERVEL